MIHDLPALCRQIRRDILSMTHAAGSGHPGGSLSAVEILVSLYFGQMRLDPARPDDPNRDRFLLSKGHAAPLLYSVLARRGYFDPALLPTLRQLGSPCRAIPTWPSSPAWTAPPVPWARVCPSPTAWPWPPGAPAGPTGPTACWGTGSSRRARCGRPP